MNKNLVDKIILIFFLVILIGFGIYEIIISNSFIYDTIVLIFILGLAYQYKDKIDLRSSHFVLYGLWLVLHNMGVFGLYDMYFFGIEFDTYVHTFFGVILGLVLFRAYDKLVPLKNNKIKYFLIITLVLGLTAFHEILEYLGGAYLGEGMGFLKAGASDIEMWDTQTDMRNNLLGSLAVLGYYWLKGKFVKKSEI